MPERGPDAAGCWSRTDVAVSDTARPICMFYHSVSRLLCAQAKNTAKRGKTNKRGRKNKRGKGGKRRKLEFTVRSSRRSDVAFVLPKDLCNSDR